MNNYIISGIQQIGIGVRNLQEAWEWYNIVLGMDCKIFDDIAEANLMLPYTGGKPRSRHAILAINLQSGGGFEVWQYKDREPRKAASEPLIGDLGIFACKIKVKSIDDTLKRLKLLKVNIICEPVNDPGGERTFFIRDPYNNIFQMVEASDWFMDENKPTGGCYGAVIGVRDIEKAKVTYSDILGYDTVAYDKRGYFTDMEGMPGGDMPLRRVLLRRSKPVKGALSKVFGQSEIELVTVENREPVKIFKDRYWGDLGFIHLCYDISGMDILKDKCSKSGVPFTVDSNPGDKESSFEMGEAAGRFAYVEDPDGTLIELVETHKIPVIKKIGWYINLRRRNPERSLPAFVLRALRFSRVKIRQFK